MFKKPTLIIDASGENVKIAFSQNGTLSAKITTDSPALESVSQAINDLCKDFSEIENYAICTGPGSMLGERFASVFASTLAKLHNAKIFEWDIMQATAFVIADSLAVSEKFALFTPSRKGFANILIFADSKIIEEKEIEISAINDFAQYKKFTLRQRKNQPVELSQFEEIQPTPVQIFQALKNHATLLSECDLPPDAKSLTKREYAKWKAQAHI